MDYDVDGTRASLDWACRIAVKEDTYGTTSPRPVERLAVVPAFW